MILLKKEDILSEPTVLHNHYLDHVALADPQTIQEAIASPQKDDWKMALNEKIRSLSEQYFFEIVQKSPHIHPLPCKWVSEIKYDKHRNLQKFQARLVAKGYK